MQAAVAGQPPCENRGLPRVETIHADTDDDIPVMRDRLEWAQSEYVLLVVPARNRVLRNLVNLKLLARLARNSGRKMALITGDPYVTELCRETDLITFSSVERAQKSRWLALSAAGAQPAMPGPQTTADEDIAVPGEVSGVDLPERPVQQVSRPKRLPIFQPKPGRLSTGLWAAVGRMLSAFGFLVLIGFLAAMMGVVLLLMYPEGRIQLKARRVPVEAEVLMHANPKADRIDYATLDIPARLAQVELRDTGRIAPTGASALPTDKAHGTATFINRTTQEVTVPMSTTISTSSGATVRFLTNITATVSASLNATTQVTITAVEAGPAGNVPAGQINRVIDPVLERQLMVINETPTIGGNVAEAGVVTRADKDRLWSIVLQKLYQEGYNRLVAELAEQEFVPPESVVVLPLEGTFTPSLDGEATDQLSLDMRAVVRGTVVGGQYANQLALAALQAQVPANHKLDPRSLKFVMGQVTGVTEEQVVSFKMQSYGEAVAQIDTSQVTSEVRGLPLEQARRLLSQQLLLDEEPAVTVEPNWLGRLPWLPFRISVMVVE
jgi:hypothetical protein